ncbi:preprotein translocase YidC [Vulcanibacillus modesticaldus]|uniref:Membrane protein insertase YidC n=1 Tax=Vulcanibacillus modesticaldus TaxID=337097 RepID=A0A1D2YVH2_9BACI|nr:membrane protein insertase YidC [Vulcanibacillus modesticaldus]OEF99625.1 preprotein translocase YidC [Vulcanibacillus modesticaldus]
MKKKLIVFTLLLAVVLLSTGCSARPETPIDPSSGIWDKYFVYPLSYMLDFFAKLLFNNYGLSIIVVTIIVRFLVLPLMITQIKSTKAMQELQPEINKIKEKYKDNPQKINEETMKLFQKHNVNPLAGCLPILIQMPILIAFYHAIMRNSHIASSTFLGIQLGETDPFYILPIIAAITTYLQIKVSSGANTSVNNQAAQQQKIMSIFMPAMILFIGISLPSALALYWVIGNIFSIVQSKIVYSK